MSSKSLYVAIALFIFGAGFGLHLLSHILKDKMTPKSSIVMHGLLGGTALVLVILYCLRHTANAPITSLVILLLAAVGGFVLLAYDIGNKKIPKMLAIGHPIIAACGLIALIYFVVT